jgi:DNA-binding NarL/FixJ family response regulator
MGASVLIVDDHSGFRAQARRMLETEGYRVVGEAGDVASAIEAARALEPELALVDVYLPDAGAGRRAGRGIDLEPRWRRAHWLRGRERRLRVCTED